MSQRINDDSMACDGGFGRMGTAGREPNTYRVGAYFCRAGMAEITEYKGRDGEQVIRFDTVMHERHHIRTITRTGKRMTERGMYIVAGRWLRELEVA